MATTAAQMKQKAKKAPEKDTFKWTGTDKRGRKVSGEMGGANIALIRAQLRRQGITPDKVKKKPKPLFGERKSHYSGGRGGLYPSACDHDESRRALGSGL